jgi:hypothetical protein
MPRTDADRLRALIGESIPPGGEDVDTLFTEAEIQDILDQSDDVERAAYEAWREKAAKLANLVDTTEGNSQKKFSQLLDNANDMIKLYLRSSGGPTEGRTRIGRLTRPGVEW